MEDLGLAQAVMTQANRAASDAEFKLDTQKVLQLYSELPLAPSQSVEALEKRVDELFGHTANHEAAQIKYRQICAQSVDLIFSWLSENKHVPLAESSAYQALQELKDKQSVKEGEFKAEQEIKKANQVVESVDAAAEGEQAFQDAVIPDSEVGTEGAGLENALAVAPTEEPAEMQQRQQVLEDPVALADDPEPIEEEPQVVEVATEEIEPAEEVEDEPKEEAEPEVSPVNDTHVELGEQVQEEQDQEQEEQEELENQEITDKPESPLAAEDEFDLKVESTSPAESVGSFKSETPASARTSSPEQDADESIRSTRSSAEPDQKRKRGEDSGGNDSKRRRTTKKRKPTQRALAWAKEFFSEQSVGFELDDQEVVIDYQEPSEIEERVHDEEIYSVQDLVLAVMKTYADYTMANATPGQPEVPIAEVDKWIKQLRLFS